MEHFEVLVVKFYDNEIEYALRTWSKTLWDTFTVRFRWNCRKTQGERATYPVIFIYLVLSINKSLRQVGFRIVFSFFMHKVSLLFSSCFRQMHRYRLMS